ncbi:glutathione synthase [Candidatus Endobugula sertula]|uniref:Glutathione synthetase n=1 Tax=Candidatus Endobugula sertula TaxID=62101 RepID=A0A1D2QSJ0_9GAMM|nr:glutathione synthase [Candidatus Endobugula sertula]
MSLRLGVVMDPIAHINYYKDTTLALLLAAKELAWELLYFEQNDLFLNNEVAKGYGRPLKVFANNDQWYNLGAPKAYALGDLDVILMRKDPPFNIQFLQATYILEVAHQQGCLVINNPRSLRDCNEKLFAAQFPQCCPPLTVSSNIQHLRDFHQLHQDVIFKPIDGMGGSGIFHCKENDPNLGVILETLTEQGQQLVMAQKFIPDIKEGDKRILVIHGEAVPYCLARVPAKGETRGNLAAGGRGLPQPITDRDRWIVKQVAPSLIEKGLLFVGLDVIGRYLTEINVTSPTCAQEIDRAYDTNIGQRLMNAIIQQHKAHHTNNS